MLMEDKSKGFTLIELMIIIAVIGIVAAIALPGFKSIIDGRKLVGASDTLYAALLYARSEAIKQNQTIQFQFDTGAWCYGIDDTGADCDCTNPASCTISGVSKVYNDTDFSGVNMTTASFTGSSLTFDPLRGLVSDDGIFILTIGSQTKQVSINLIGRVSVN